MAITKLRLALLEHGLPQYKVAARIGCPSPRISEWANGKKPIAPRYLGRLAMLFGCDPADLQGFVAADMDGCPVIN